MTAVFAGFALGFSLILAIGAQNAFVLRQGLRDEHVLAICLTCALSDAILITLGVGGMGAVVKAAPGLEHILRLGGAGFLLVYGAMRFYAAWKGGEVLAPGNGGKVSLGAALSTCLLLTWANPHVYLDTVVLLGSVSTHWPGRTVEFGLGAAASSVVFFFGLGYGAALLRPLFARAGAWRILEIVVGLTMWTIAAKLLHG
ncbi:LysE/ArgO family amino acid transporter [Frigidibacter sp. ROC022]|uniref:LysE/ArgO family amino acid transporter n=1 Tax=Frigidibacter sp. ROC022 TaxID=2971796 RepID=UPI00215A5D0D|nr:LysE/ArgO family amino acid transporter [Frigidibacter sp. ROC022]MCR8725817.1 LysE/ArgO family amino acid transporter [Frigidibacter sp. ROC022]